MRRSVRKRSLAFFAIAAVNLAFISCTGTAIKRPYTLDDHYKTANLSARKQVVAFPSDKGIIINNIKDVVKSYGGLNVTPESRIRKFYFSEMFSAMKSFVSGDSMLDLGNYRPGLAWDSLSTKTVTLKTGGDSVPTPYSVPEKAGMTSVGMDSTVVIIIETIEFKRNNFKCEYFWDPKSRVPASLEATAKIMIWDYANDMPVFYGPVSLKTEFQFGLQRKHWDKSAGDLAKKIVIAAKCL